VGVLEAGDAALSGIKRTWVDSGDSFALKSEFDEEPILADNEKIYNANSLSSQKWQGRDYVLVARIPNWLIEFWHRRGINFYSKEDWWLVKKILNDFDWKRLRTAPGRI
jgi:hypothetical protein